ncbi:MAG: T9SS type A sorting domain-containing protein [Bacteroidia bacterium]|nr:T9SS type A sorting domain-containing protein [Sphingobacteriaceae bacterium]MBK7816697.1 T9SS type A sorting domain-containing protein [Sphingobacteriaceae bacterium]MBP9068239.1 T9SS type A sorting domain-containing protein [Bacteroidia bacterium]
MKKILPILLLCIVNYTTAQVCSVTIAPSPGHVQVTSNQSLNATGTVYWICTGISVTVTGSPGSTYLLEQNAVLTINATSGDAIFAKPGSTIINNSTAAISVTSNTNNVTRTNASTGFILDIFCPTVTLNYSQVGIGPCSDVTGMNDEQLNLFTIAPNPVASGSQIKISSDRLETIEAILFDLNGKIISTEKGNVRTISTENLLAGVYVLQLNCNGHAQRTKLLIQ